MLSEQAKHRCFGNGGEAGPTRRQLLRGLVGCIASFSGIVSARAGERKWYDSVFNQPCSEGASHEYRSRRAGAARRPDDLRAGPVPLRSDEMLDRLDRAIERYRRIVKKGGWPKLAKLRFLRRGDNHALVPALRRQLVITGDIPSRGAKYYAESRHFDEWMEHGIKRFQKRHGLRVTGRLDRSTRVQLNVSARTRLKQLTLNRRRVAELLRSSAHSRYVLVNIPGFQLEAVERHEVKRRHRVIVGRSGRQTPLLSATIRGLNFFPYWHVPESIARLDLVPRLRRDPDYLKREHIRAARGSYAGPEIDTENVDWRKVKTGRIKFRQDPGPWNALGLVRIDMPNKDIVYLHDTPLKGLFRQHRRAFSAGCVRVQDVMDLVAWIAKYEPGFSDRGTIDEIIKSADPAALREKRPSAYDIRLRRPVPVQFVYISAWVEDDGQIEFRPDVYRRDGTSGSTDAGAPRAPASARALSP